MYGDAWGALYKKSDLRLKVKCIEMLGERFINKSNIRLKVKCIERLGERFIKM